MTKRRTADQITRLLKNAERDLAKGLTVAYICRKISVAQTTYYRWKLEHDPARVDGDRRRRQLEAGIGRLNLLVAELMFDKQMLQEISKTKTAKLV